jgi:hypothetical protein
MRECMAAKGYANGRLQRREDLKRMLCAALAPFSSRQAASVQATTIIPTISPAFNPSSRKRAFYFGA